MDEQREWDINDIIGARRTARGRRRRGGVMMAREVIGILYDDLVHNYPIVEQLMWWHSPNVEFVVPCGPGYEPVMRGVTAINTKFRDSPSGISLAMSAVPKMDIGLLDRLWIIRSHPEMFGAEIREWSVQKGSLAGVLIITYEDFGEGGRRVGESVHELMANLP